MKRSSRVSNELGMTLVELLVTAAVISAVLTSLCGIFLAVYSEWDRGAGEGQALLATSNACSRVADYTAQAVSAQTFRRFLATDDTLAICMPANSAYGIYVPTWSGGQFRCLPGTWIVFYLSDSTGGYARSGDILWAGTFTTLAGFPANVVPDQSWSLYYDQSAGRIAPLSSLEFVYDASGSRPSVTIKATSQYDVRKSNVRQLQLSRTVCLRNSG